MQEAVTQNNQLQKIVEESNLDKTESQILLEKFSGYFDIAAEWERKIKEIKVTDVSQSAEMKMNREGRLFLKGKRLEVESTRKQLKEESLRKGQTIDSIAKILKNLIEPLEEECEKNEKFKELKEAEEKLERKNERLNKLIPYNVAVDANLIGDMSNEMFDNYYNGVVKSHNDRIEAEAKAEADRLAALEAERKRQLAIEAENKRLKAEAEAKEKRNAIRSKELHPYIMFIRDYNKLLNMDEAEYKKELHDIDRGARDHYAYEAKKKIEIEAAEAKAAEERKANEEKLRLERLQREKIEAELKAKQLAEEKAKQEAETKLKAERVAAEKAAKAPIKKQLSVWVESFSITTPTTSNETTKTIQEKFEAFKKWAKTQVDAL